MRSEAADATSAADVARVVGSAVAFLGGLDTLVVSAGTSDVQSVFTVTPERFDLVVSENFSPLYLSAHAAALHPIASGRISIVAIASIYG